MDFSVKSTRGSGRPVPPRSAAILAGGASTRMGCDKALLSVRGSGILERTIALLRPLAADLFIVASDRPAYARFRLPVLPDLLPGRGALIGIHAALAQAAHPRVLCVACDMPLIGRPLLELLLAAGGPEDDALIPRPPAGPEPLLAVYDRGLLPRFEAAVRAGRLGILEALAGARVRFLAGEELERADPGWRSFVNLNTPEDLAAAEAPAGLDRA